MANLILGLVVSSGGVIGIDNAAHLGGTLNRMLPDAFWIYWQGYELIPKNRPKAFFVLLALSGVLALGAARIQVQATEIKYINYEKMT